MYSFSRSPFYSQLLALFFFGFSAFATDLSLKTNGNLKAAFMQAVRDGALDDTGVATELSFQFVGVNDPSLQDGLFAFESEILDLFHKGSNETEIEKLTAKWGFSSDEAFDISIYYGTRVFADSKKENENSRAIFDRLRRLSLERYIREHQTEYDYYARNVTILSTQQMAKELNSPEHKVYQRLGAFRIAIIPAFQRKMNPDEVTSLRQLLHDFHFDYLSTPIDETQGALEQLRKLEQIGVPYDKIIIVAQRVFGFGEQALRFVFHAEKIMKRDQRWNQSTTFGGQELTETEILIRLYESGLSRQQIAERLNRLFQRQDPDDLRTEGGITGELNYLGFSDRNLNRMNESYLADYGYLIRSGMFVQPLMFQFLVDHHDKDINWLAEKLNVPPLSIQRFMKRHHIDFLDNFPTGGRVQKTMSRYVLQTRVLQSTIAWMRDPAKGNGRTPRIYEIAQLTGIPRQKLTALAAYADNGVFDSAIDLYTQLKMRANDEGVFVSLLDVTFVFSSDDLVKARRSDALKIAFDYFSTHRVSVEKLPIDYARLTGSRDYAPGGELANYAIFPSAAEFWSRYKEYAAARGIEFFVVKSVSLRGANELMRKILQQESLELLYRWIAAHNGEIPREEDISRDLSLHYDSLKGFPSAAKTNTLIFDNPIHFYVSLKRYCEERGLRIWLLKEKFRSMNDELRDILQAEMLDILTDWVKDPNGGDNTMPTMQLLKARPAKISTLWSRLVGLNQYSSKNELFEFRIFDSKENMISRLKEHLDEGCEKHLRIPKKSR